MSDDMPTHYAIDRATLRAAVDYLSERPYREVAPLLRRLTSLPLVDIVGPVAAETAGESETANPPPADGREE